MTSFNPNSTSRLRTALYYRYSIVSKAGLKIPSLYFYFCSAFTKLLFLYIYRIHSCSAPLIAIDNINIVCEYVIYWIMLNNGDCAGYPYEHGEFTL